MRLFSWGSMTALAFALVLATPIVAQQIIPDPKAPAPARFAQRAPAPAHLLSTVSYPDRSPAPLSLRSSRVDADDRARAQDE